MQILRSLWLALPVLKEKSNYRLQRQRVDGHALDGRHQDFESRIRKRPVQSGSGQDTGAHFPYSRDVAAPAAREMHRREGHGQLQESLEASERHVGAGRRDQLLQKEVHDPEDDRREPLQQLRLLRRRRPGVVEDLGLDVDVVAAEAGVAEDRVEKRVGHSHRGHGHRVLRINFELCERRSTFL